MRERGITRIAKKKMERQQSEAQKIDRRARNAKAKTAEEISNVFIPTRETVLQEVIQTISESAMLGEYICHVRVKPKFESELIRFLRERKYIGIQLKSTQENNTIIISWIGLAYINLYCGDIKGNKSLKYGEIGYSKLMNYINENFDYEPNKSKLTLISPTSTKFEKSEAFLNKIGKYVAAIK